MLPPSSTTEAKKSRFSIGKPLSDCTNTLTKSSQSSTSTLSSSILKPSKPIRKPSLLCGDNTHHLHNSNVSSVRMQSSASNTEIRHRLDPQSSFSRRHATLKRKVVGKDIGMALSCSPTSIVPNDGGMMKKRGSSGRTKRQLSNQNSSNKNLDQDFIEQQRLYFAEIDAFELLEEEVGSDEELG